MTLRSVQVAPRPVRQPSLRELSQAPARSLGAAARLAVVTLWAVTRNALLSSLVAWLAAFAFSRGDVTHGPPSVQSHTEFLTATLLWGDFFCCTGVFATRTSSLFRLRLVKKPDERIGWRRALAMVLVRTLWLRAVVTSAVYALGRVSGDWTPRVLRPLRLEVYVGVLLTHANTVYADVVARRIYKFETVEGRAQGQRRPGTETSMCSTTTSLNSVSLSPKRTFRLHGRQSTISVSISSFHTRAGNLPMLACISMPILYVHVISRSMTRNANVLVFTGVSLAVKVLTQELAKLYIFKHKRASLRSMAVIVVVPTVMVDTQTRLVLMLQQSTNSAISGLVLLAVLEIAIRVLKLIVMRESIRRHQRKLAGQSTAAGADGESRAALEVECEAWVDRVKRYHMTETSADMYAEYLAIGCSYAIVFFFRDHPHFSLNGNRQQLLGRSQVIVLGFQVGVELVVDWMSCCVEILFGGLDFGSLERDRTFYVVFFMTLALLNIFVSSALYLKDS